jgi:hypothetical protein
MALRLKAPIPKLMPKNLLKQWFDPSGFLS